MPPPGAGLGELFRHQTAQVPDSLWRDRDFSVHGAAGVTAQGGAASELLLASHVEGGAAARADVQGELLAGNLFAEGAALDGSKTRNELHPQSLAGG